MNLVKWIYNKCANVRYFREHIVNSILFKITGCDIIGKPKAIRGVLTIRSCRKGSIKLGRDIVINSGRKYNLVGNEFRTIFRTIQNGTIVIGDRVGISNSAIVSASQIIIEDDVMIGSNCKLWDTDFHPLAFEDRVHHDSKGGKSKPIVIKKGAFLGADVLVLKGVTIGERAVIGAGSVVTKNIPNDETWAGNPAVRIG